MWTLAGSPNNQKVSPMTTKKPTAAPVEPLLYSIDQTCGRLNIGRTMLYKAIKAGEIETIEIGDRRFTTDEHQRAYIARKQRRGRAA
jgi:hypothetical protein